MNEDSLDEICNKIAALENRVNGQERFIDGIEGLVRSRLDEKRLIIIPIQPSREIIRAMGEVRRSKLSNEDYMKVVYRMIVSHYRDEQAHGPSR